MKISDIFKKNKKMAISRAGFTVIELLVVVSIMIIMTTVVLFNYNKFNDSMLLGGLAYDVSLTIRQAQTYGVAVLETPGKGASTLNHDNFTSSYGVSFISGNNYFTLFAGDPTNIIQKYSFQKGVTISGISSTGGGNLNPSPNNVTPYLRSLDISFTRPDPDAIFNAVSGGGFRICDPSNPMTHYVCSAASVTIGSSDHKTFKTISVTSTGQISVQ